MPRRKVNLPLLEVIGISVILHLVGLFVLGGLTVWNLVKEAEPEFEAPQVPEEAIEPQKLRVQIQKAQKQSAQPRQVVQVQNISQLNLPSLDVDMPTINSKVAVSAGAGAGSGLGRGFGSGGLDIAKSAVNFFGIQSTGENIVFVVDVTRSMLDPSRGDVRGFNRVKEEINRMIEGLSPGTLFNIYAYERGLDVYKANPVPATTENKESAKKWINQYWTFTGANITGKQGANSNNYRPTYTDDMPVRKQRIVQSGSGANWNAVLEPIPKENWGHSNYASSRMDLAMLAAFENSADNMFIITDGTPRVADVIDEKDFKKFVREVQDWEEEKVRLQGTNKWAKYVEELAEYRQKVAAYQEARRKKGLPPEIRENNRIGNIPHVPPPHGWRPSLDWNRTISFEELNDMLRDRARELYKERDQRLPSVHIVGYGVTEKTEEELESLQRGFPNSKYRTLESEELKPPTKDGGKS